MKKQIIAMTCLLPLVFAGCASDGTTGTEVPPETTQPAVEEVQYQCPWEYDVCEQAKHDGELHYYFMSSEGQIVDERGIEPAKWGDCCLIVFPDGQTMLIDCGVADYGPILVENLNRMLVKRLDYILITHPHSDHQNGIFHADNLTGEGVLDSFEIGQVFHRGGIDPNRSDSRYVETVCAERSIPLRVLEMGNLLQIGAVSARVLWPKPGTSEKEITGTANVNNSSIVMRFDYGEHSSLFAADLYDDGEFSMMSAQDTTVFDADLLKAPHHGGYTSGSSVFLNIVSAELAVATGYMPIRDDVNSRYAASKTPIWNDLTYGYIHVFTNGKNMTWESSRQEPLLTKQSDISG